MLTQEVLTGTGQPAKRWAIGRIVVKIVIIASLLGNLYLVGLLRHSPGSYSQLTGGGTAAFPGTVTKAAERSITIETTDGAKTIAVGSDTPYALFPKDYQTLIPIGLPSSRDDVVAGSTEASVSAQLPYLKQPQALRINLVRDDVATGKVLEVSDKSLKYTAFAASGAKEETRTLSDSLTVLKLEQDSTTSVGTREDISKDRGLYAFLSGPATDASAQIVKLIVADFTAPAQ